MSSTKPPSPALPSWRRAPSGPNRFLSPAHLPPSFTANSALASTILRAPSCANRAPSSAWKAPSGSSARRRGGRTRSPLPTTLAPVSLPT